jgi:signal peptidase I
MGRVLVRLLGILAVLGVAFGILWIVGLLVPVSMKGTADMAPSIPACNGRVLVEGFTYRWRRDPERSEIVAIHASGTEGGEVTPDAESDDVTLVRRVVGLPGDEVIGRDGNVYVNGFKIDDIQTAPFPRTEVGPDRYFVLGDNRSATRDSRDFGAVPDDAIFGRVLWVYWPLGDFGSPELRHEGPPPGPGLCD